MPKSSSGDSYIPSVEQLNAIVSQSSSFLRHVYECGLIENNPPLGFTNEAMDSRRWLMASYFLNWSMTLNPQHKKSSNDGFGICVSKWPDHLSMLHSLRDLISVYFQILNHWNLAPLLEEEKVSFTNESLLIEETGEWLEGQDFSCSKCIPLVWAQQLERVIHQLSNAVNALSTDAVNNSTPHGKLSEGALPEWIGEHFKAKQFKLIKALWNKKEVSIKELLKLLYPSESGKDDALDKLKQRANAKLADNNISYEIKERRGEVFLIVPLK